MKKRLGFKLYKKDEESFRQATFLILILWIFYLIVWQAKLPEVKQTLMIMEAFLIGYVLFFILKRDK